jgi:hypothetical protein
VLQLSLVLLLGCPQEINVRVEEDEDTGEFVDRDGDGFGIAEDCDDNDAAVNPDADELCATPGIDDDCDGTADGRDDLLVGAYANDDGGTDVGKAYLIFSGL